MSSRVLYSPGLKASSQLVAGHFCHWTASICAGAMTALLLSDPNPFHQNANARVLIDYREITKGAAE